MYNKATTEPEPGIMCDWFTFFCEVNLPEISHCQEDYKNATENDGWRLKIADAIRKWFNNNEQRKYQVEQLYAFMNIFVVDLPGI